jgi:hypothetical protein
VAFSISGVLVAQRQTGFCRPVPGIFGLPALRGRACQESPDVREKPARTDDPRTLAETPAADGRGVAGNESVRADDLRSQETTGDLLYELVSVWKLDY